jgi:hypothetical protein
MGMRLPEAGNWKLEALFDNFVKNFTLLGPGWRRRTGANGEAEEDLVGFCKSPRFE